MIKISLGLFFAAVAGLASGTRDDIHVLMYETDTSIENDPTSPLAFFKERSSIAGLPTTTYGGGLEYHGFGDKYQTLKAILEVIDPSKLVVVADARDVALNVPDNPEAADQAIDRFVNVYNKLTVNNPNAVVVSAEGQCCVSAMTWAHPSEYFDPVTQKRTKRACSSGKPGCHWIQNDNIYAWVDFHRQRAFNSTGIERTGENVGDVYLNAGLMAGYPEDLIALVDLLDISPAEDDQAVLSGLMYQFPDKIVLDYGQEMFGNNRWPKGLEDGCVFETFDENIEPSQTTLSHRDTGAEPLLLHTPGKFYGCLDMLIEELGGPSQQRYLQESPAGNPRALRREGKNVDYESNDNKQASLLQLPQSRALEEDGNCDCDCDERRKLGIWDSFLRVLGIGKSFQAMRADKAVSKDDEDGGKQGRFEDVKYDEKLVVEDTIVAEVNYGVADESNYGIVDTSSYGSADVPNYGVVVDSSSTRNYGIAGGSNYGNYGVAGSSNYGYGVADTRNYGVASPSNYGYGVADSCTDICATECSSMVRRRI